MAAQRINCGACHRSSPTSRASPEVERLRLNALRSHVLREIDDAVSYYRRLAERDPRDARAWLDLGRALEAAGRHAEARGAYERAI